MARNYDNLADDDRIFLEVGRCIHHWSLVELNMAALFSFLYVPMNAPPAQRYAMRAPFDAVIAFEVRRTMLDIAIQKSTLADDVVRRKWAALSKRLTKNYKKRHEIAHYTIRHKDDSKTAQILQPFYTFSSWRSGKAKPPLTHVELVERRKQFISLADDVADYIGYLIAIQSETKEALEDRQILAARILGDIGQDSEEA